MIVYGVDENGNVVPLPIRSDGYCVIAGKQTDGTVTPILVDQYGRLILSEAVMANWLQIEGGHNAIFSPADSTVYHYGRSYSIPQTAEGFSKMFVLGAATLKRVLLLIRVRGTLGTAQSSIVKLLVNGVEIMDILPEVYYNAAELVYVSADVGVVLAANSYIELKTTMPVFATNPTNVEIVPSFYLELPA